MKDLLKGVDYKLKGDDKVEVNGLALDSRIIKEGFLFAAVTGTKIDGRIFIADAQKNGAKVILCELWPQDFQSELTYILVDDVVSSLGIIANNFYNRPSSKLKCVGITGTNGKTSIATLLYRLFKELGFKVGLISTVEILINEKKWIAELTTPDVISLHRLFAEMVEDDCTHVFMEVSSHAIDQNRIAGVDFSGGVFSNITHDHLDYHGDFKTYIKAKQAFFSELPKSSFALTNIDDKNGEVMVQKCNARILRYSLRKLTDYKSKILSEELIGMHLEIDGFKFITRLAGKFNAENLTAVYATAKQLEGIDSELLIAKISGLHGAKGRMEIVSHEPRVIVDYAHTPDALQNVLKTLKVTVYKGRLITVVGCGGDRDKLKRKIMGRIAAENSDFVVLTSDNPRSEDPQVIIDEMALGAREYGEANLLEIADRKSAIKTALALSNKNDTIIIAGKGHEEYQEIKGVKHFFSDQKIVKDILSKDI